jgi:hypothetical protein|tara:strand:+ start:547 stop:1119 length:573 start_codon:yes stop_codon:yes gene_type:complete
MATEKLNLMFSKPNGILMGVLTKEMEEDSRIDERAVFLIKEVEIDVETQYYDGDYETGSVKPMHDRPTIRESELIYGANVKVLQKYPIHKQINIIIEMLNQSELPNTPRFEELRDYIDRYRKDVKEQIAIYKADPDTYDFISVADELKQDALKSDALEITEDANGKVKVITKPELQIDTIEQMLDSNKKK